MSASFVSRSVISNQTGLHERLGETVRRHLTAENKQPISDRSRAAFTTIKNHIDAAGGAYILDACCGVGDSTRALAHQNPDVLVVGIDKSAHRLAKERSEAEPDNMVLVRADLNDLYRLFAREALRPLRHYILYPNPWPKAAHLKRRWHGAPVFPDIVALGGELELRSNWKLYLQEFSVALRLLGVSADVETFSPAKYLTPFERKYHESGQALWRLRTCG